jgi:hypothetical protein
MIPSNVLKLAFTVPPLLLIESLPEPPLSFWWKVLFVIFSVPKLLKLAAPAGAEFISNVLATMSAVIVAEMAKAPSL